MPVKRIGLLALLVLAASALYLCWNVQASWSFVLPFRGAKLLTLLVVGWAIGVATLLFQTLCQNRILTPGIMGFDALYMLLQSLLMLTLGGLGYASLSPLLKFALEAVVMILAMLLLFKLFFRGNAQSLQLLLLSGVVIGFGLTSLNGLLLRIMDPTQTAVVQNAYFASFSASSNSMLLLAAVLLLASSAYLWRIRKHLDVLLLGEATANNLGVDFTRYVNASLVVVALLVALSTALVGPITFLGLLVVHLTYRLVGSYQHQYALPFAALVGVFILVLGEWAMQHLFSFQAPVGIVIELFGGLVFLLLIYRQGRACLH